MRADAPSLGRHLAAIFYDSLLLLAILIIASALWTATPMDPTAGLTRILFQLYLLGIMLLFYCGFWLKGGETLGLRTWKLKLVSQNGDKLRTKQALIRFFGAWVSGLCFGLGFLWIYRSPERLSWHDQWSGTRLQFNNQA